MKLLLLALVLCTKNPLSVPYDCCLEQPSYLPYFIFCTYPSNIVFGVQLIVTETTSFGNLARTSQGVV